MFASSLIDIFALKEWSQLSTVLICIHYYIYIYIYRFNFLLRGRRLNATQSWLNTEKRRSNASFIVSSLNNKRVRCTSYLKKIDAIKQTKLPYVFIFSMLIKFHHFRQFRYASRYYQTCSYSFENHKIMMFRFSPLLVRWLTIDWRWLPSAETLLLWP